MKHFQFSWLKKQHRNKRAWTVSVAFWYQQQMWVSDLVRSVHVSFCVNFFGVSLWSAFFLWCILNVCRSKLATVCCKRCKHSGYWFFFSFALHEIFQPHRLQANNIRIFPHSFSPSLTHTNIHTLKFCKQTKSISVSDFSLCLFFFIVAFVLVIVVRN